MVWRTLLEQPDEWWVADLRCYGPGSIVRLDARPGGHLTETTEDGRGLLWYTVTEVVPGEALNLLGVVAPPYGGPYQNTLLIRLDADGDGTRVRLTNAMSGVVDESARGPVEEGWRALLDRGIRARGMKPGAKRDAIWKALYIPHLGG
ncbi:MAG: SRPBCC family protein [Opitutales bacterium]